MEIEGDTMLWSLIKIILFFALIGATSFGALELLALEGGIRIAIAGQEYSLTPLQAVIALVLLVIAVWIFLKVMGLLLATFHFLNGDETAISRYFDRNRERKGFGRWNAGTCLWRGTARYGQGGAGKQVSRPP